MFLSALAALLLAFTAALSIPEQTKGDGQKSQAGLTKAAAIEVCNPEGEEAYLDRLRCPDGAAVRYKRTGSFGFRNEPQTPEEEEAILKQMDPEDPLPPGQKDFHVVDGYEVRCKRKKVRVYLDMYHCPEPGQQQIPPGYSLVEKPK